ncbi:MAG: protein kinase [Candidatus Melainabacteria bacterium]|nr:protein kinase [Candidatus Melainabacteria bacterium]
MLTKDTRRFVSRGFIRSLSGTVARKSDTGELVTYQILIPQDKLDLLVGITLEDRYYVMSLLGKGGMSLVYKAKDMKTGEIVAVKCLRTQVLGDEMVVKRFKREADVLDRLNHPRIVNFYGYGTNRRGQPYFVMDYLIGTSLGEILRTEGRLELGRFQDIFVQVAAAIGHAHKHDAVHRDIKPGNIMLVERGGTSDYVKIVDFGIAKVTEGTQKLTRVGEVWGSPIYMSPEQCVGGGIDSRTDIYSLGVVMYEALTGEVPFLGRNYADTMMKQISEEPPTFKQANPKIEIPAELEAIVFRAMQKKPEARYQTMMEVKRDLEKALNNSVEILPKPQPSLLSVSGKHQITDVVPDYEIDSRRVTSDQLSNNVKIEKPASELQQRVTSEDVPRFGSQERLNQTTLKSGPPAAESTIPPVAKPADMKPARAQAPTPVPDLDFAPPEDKRTKFELTGPHIISASTDSVAKPASRSSPRASGQNLAQSRPGEITNDRQRIGGEGRKKTTSSMRTPRKNARTSRNRLPAGVADKLEKDTARSGKYKPAIAKEGGGVIKQLLIALLIFAAVIVGYANRDYFDSFVKEVFTFPGTQTSPGDTSSTGAQSTDQKIESSGSTDAEPTSTEPSSTDLTDP